jgi:hypothetical protein
MQDAGAVEPAEEIAQCRDGPRPAGGTGASRRPARQPGSEIGKPGICQVFQADRMAAMTGKESKEGGQVADIGGDGMGRELPLDRQPVAPSGQDRGQIVAGG